MANFLESEVLMPSMRLIAGPAEFHAAQKAELQIDEFEEFPQVVEACGLPWNSMQ
jgi:hypothetical protein